MATDITMPKLSDTMTEGVLIEWRKNVGQQVERGEIIAEVETDKANMELESFTAGVLLETRVAPGQTVPVGAVIAVIGEAGEKAAAAPADEPQREKPEPAAPSEEKEKPAPPPAAGPEKAAPEKTADERGNEEELRRETGLEEMGEGVTAGTKPEAARVAPAPTEVRGEAPSQAPAAGEKASPLVRRLAREKGIDLARVQGSGPEGRILQEDLARLEGGQKPAGAAVPEAGKEGRAAAAPEETPSAPQPLSRMRGAIARVVAEAWRTIPHFTVTVAIDMGEAERVRQELKEADVSCSLNDFVVKGAALVIEKFPLVNASFTEEGIVRHAEVNIGVAVALEDGLLIPVIKGCRSLSLRELAARSRELVDRARSGKATEDDLKGGTFSVSNMGKYGVEQFMAVIYPNQAAILAVGAVMDQPVIREGHVAAARVMKVTLSGDHRLIDGAYAARFLQELKTVLESPVRMLV